MNFEAIISLQKANLNEITLKKANLNRKNGTL